MKNSLLKLRLILTFYRSYFFASFLLTGAFAFIYWEYGEPVLTTLFWGKLASLFIIYLFIKGYKKKEFYYYQNFGLSKKVLWISTMSFDILLYLFLIAQVNHLQ